MRHAPWAMALALFPGAAAGSAHAGRSHTNVAVVATFGHPPVFHPFFHPFHPVFFRSSVFVAAPVFAPPVVFYQPPAYYAPPPVCLSPACRCGSPLGRHLLQGGGLPPV